MLFCCTRSQEPGARSQEQADSGGRTGALTVKSREVGRPGATFFLMNPYAKFIGDRAPVDVIAATPLRLAELVKGLGEAGVNRSFAPGKWSARKILCHLADCEVVFAFRLRQT